MRFFHCLVRFSCSLDLNSVAQLVSEHLFGGLSFVQTNEFDEVPGMRLKSKILMLEVRICGATPEFGLNIDTEVPQDVAEKSPKLEIINIGSYVETALKGIDQITILPS